MGHAVAYDLADSEFHAILISKIPAPIYRLDVVGDTAALMG
jgi:hypothetical protein